MREMKPFSPESVAASHAAVALCVEAFVRLPDADRRRTRGEFAKLLDDEFRNLFHPAHGFSLEDQEDIHRIWEELRGTIRLPILKRYRPWRFVEQ